MRAFIPAIALCAVLQATAAAQPAHQAVPAANGPGAGTLHAQLVTASAEPVVVAQHVSDTASRQPGVQPVGASAQPTPGEEHRPTTAAMLLAAVILMTGIAARRWGAGEQ